MKVAILHSQDASEDPVLGQIEHALRNAQHTVQRISVCDVIAPVVTTLSQEKPDLIFNLAESFDGKSALESNIAGLLNLLGLQYTGSSPAGLLMAGDKTLTKKILGFHGIKSPAFASIYRGAVDWAGDIEFPLIVKPPQEDASLGVTSASIVRDVKELFERIEGIQDEFTQPALVEEFVDGREFYVGVIGNTAPRALPVVEMDFSAMPAHLPRIASYEAKWGIDGSGKGVEFEATKSVMAAGVDPELITRMQAVACDVFAALRLRDYARIDLRVKEDGTIYVIEVNPNCYLEKSAEFAMAAAADGISHEQLITDIIDLAVARYHR